ncbi:MAG: L-glutamate gamma-semialdehyde dehydrogenase, partial [Pirellulaceae bacterium]
SEPEFRDRADVGIVIQCYLKDAARDLHELADWAERRGAPIWVRLVKGAYWDYETIHARATGWPVPCFEQKWQSDANFERATRFLMSRHASIRPALGSHNIRSLAHGLAVAEALGVPREAYELQMLYGMADAEKQVLVRLGHRLRIYMPYGELIPGMAYLVRRLLENTSNNSFLRAGFVEHLDRARLLAAPGGKMAVTSSESGAAKMPVESDSRPSPWPPFANEPPVDFARETSRTRMEAALADVRRHMGKHFPLVIGGQRVDTGSRMSSFDPSLKSRLVGTVAAAERPHVDAAVRAALQAQPDWARRGANRRGEMLRRMATILRQRHFELAAWQIYECGKGWREATNDVCEAIDFCEYYARGAVELERPRGVHLPGEENQFEYVPRGVVATIAPWNFPLAILTGMTAAALATGNTVVMKPAEQSALVGALLMEVAEQAGIPDGVLNFLPGAGEVVGAALVEHPDVAVIAFTGSRAVGLAINARAAEVSGGQAPLVKRVIAEMGGKNCIIVDEDADLDEAVLGVIRSAFGYQGQKCSACSRVVVLPGVHDAFLRRLVDAARSLRVGPADSPATDVSPVINEEAWTRIHEFVSVGREEGKQVLAADVGTLAEQGYFVGPHIFVDVSPQARIAQEEIFGPVLALIRASDLDEAIRIANGTPYALTGGIYSRNPAHVERAKRELMVGNLYINRPITGALVGRQPFGGFKMSGIGSQAGGPDYLLQFVLPRTISENTMRRGFAPETDSAAPASGRLEPPSN